MVSVLLGLCMLWSLTVPGQPGKTDPGTLDVIRHELWFLWYYIPTMIPGTGTERRPNPVLRFRPLTTLPRHT
jgi:hypothetical protein